jgi:hypothetical protein
MIEARFPCLEVRDEPIQFRTKTLCESPPAFFQHAEDVKDRGTRG